MKDLDTYFGVFAFMESPEALDLLNCTREIANVFLVPPSKVLKYISKTLQHLDISVVVAIVRQRADYIEVSSGGGASAAAAMRSWSGELECVPC